MTVSDLGEFELIRRLTRGLPGDRTVVRGVGDDCAVMKLDRTWYELLTNDSCIDGVHFCLGKDNPEAIGHKALARCCSDIAAMGGLVRHAVIALVVPPKVSCAVLDGMYRGIKQCARECGCVIVGGDVAHGRALVISVAMTGAVERTRVVYRNGARPGDVIMVTGTLGGSRAGKHLTFTPRLAEARFLTDHGRITAMIDISDGLMQDLEHILVASRVGGIVHADCVPIAPEAFQRARHDYRRACEAALTDGEDFELCLTVHARDVAGLMNAWRRTFPVPLTVIGEVTHARDFIVRTADRSRIELGKKGYSHF